MRTMGGGGWWVVAVLLFLCLLGTGGVGWGDTPDSALYNNNDLGVYLVNRAYMAHTAGNNGDIDIVSVPEVIWSFSGDIDYFTAAATLAFSSTSALDFSGGSGARSLLVIGLDADYNLQSETVVPTGVSVVNTANTYMRILSVEVASAGSGGANAGQFVGRDADGDAIATIAVGRNQSDYAGYTVPDNYTGYLAGCSATLSASTASGAVTAVVELREYGGLWRTIEYLTIEADGNGTASVTYPFPLVIPEKSDLRLRVLTSTADNVIVSGNLDIALVAN